MIYPKRRLHFRLWTGAALALPLILAGTYLAQSGQPESSLPPELRPMDWPEGTLLAAENLIIGKVDYQILKTDDEIFLTLLKRLPRIHLKRPDVLIYVAEGEGNERLVGSFTESKTQTFPLGLKPDTRNIRLSLYSLGHQETVVEKEIQLEEIR